MNQGAIQTGGSVGDALAHARNLLQRHPAAAADQARAIIAVEPEISEAHFLLATALRLTGRNDEAEAAERVALETSIADPVLAEVRRLAGAGNNQQAEALLRRFMADTPNDPEALRLLAGMAVRAGQLDRAEQNLRQALGLAPKFDTAKADMEALIVLQADAYAGNEGKPASPPEGEAEFDQAVKLNEQMLAQRPEDPKLWLGFGHVLRISGKQKESVEAYRKALSFDPGYGEAWWSLADLKTIELDDADRARMEAELARTDLSDQDRIGIRFALGKALADAGETKEAFRHYQAGNELRHRFDRLDIDTVDAHVRACEERFTSEFFAAREGYGHPAPDPIFIIGMPRSGSTLVEQILASHSMIEGTEELVYLGNLANIMADGRRAALEPSEFVDRVASLDAAGARNLGGAYLWNAARQRRSARPFFIDKMPRNWLYLPLIRLALPNARIIDVRRDPLECCWSNFRQLFADSGEHSYDQSDLGRYYVDYVRLVDHFDKVQPGSITRIFYEELVADPEAAVRKLLQALDLPFEPACLEFHRNRRAVKTSSSEQVRRPISTSALDQARAYEQWLGPLKQALGPVLANYPLVPESWNRAGG